MGTLIHQILTASMQYGCTFNMPTDVEDRAVYLTMINVTASNSEIYVF